MTRSHMPQFFPEARLRIRSRCAIALSCACVCALLLAGCASNSSVPPQTPPLSVEKSAAALTSRTLADPALHRFLSDNMGRDPGGAWDFEALAWAAFYFNPSLDLARAQYATAQASARHAGERPNPTISLIPGFDATHNVGLSPWLPAINFDFLFQSQKKRRLQKDIAQADADAARLTVIASAWQVRGVLRRALADLSIATRSAETLSAQTAAQHAVLTLMEQRFAAGSVTAVEVSVVRSSLLRAESAAADARGQAIAARARVAAAIGIAASALDGVALPEPPAPRPLDANALANARTAALHTRADILTALAKYQSAQSALELEVAKNHPDIHLGPGYQWDQGDSKFTFAFTFEIPLFHKNEAAIDAAVAHRAETVAQFTLVQSQVIAAIDDANAAQQAAVIQLQNAQKLSDEAQAQQKRFMQRFEIGASDQLEVQTAYLDCLMADIAMFNAKSATALAAGQLEDALQIPFANLENVISANKSMDTATHKN